MTQRPLLLTLTLAAAAAAALVVRHAAEPTRPDPPRWWEEVVEPVPETIRLRALAKRQIAREAASGSRPLVEAAALFRELNRLPPEPRPACLASLPGRTEEERLCREVILFVNQREDDWPAAAAAEAVARLEDELRRELSRDGGIRLPDPAGLPPAAELLERARAGMTEAERRATSPARHGGPPGRMSQ
jgi:hypothetical protein